MNAATKPVTNTAPRRWTMPVMAFALLLGGCAVSPLAPQSARLFNDDAFPAPSERPDAAEVFALNDAMRAYLRTDIAASAKQMGPHKGLVDALYKRGGLKLEYDSAITRNASQAFDARTGNCLSLVIMTGAFAKAMGLPVRFQNVAVDETFSRSGDIQYAIGHVNLTLGTTPNGIAFRNHGVDPLIVDFLPPEDLKGVKMHVIDEATVVAMYMNNRAAEALARGQYRDAYAWAREAIRQDPNFTSSYNTLGAVYQRAGRPADAERAYAYAIERDPRNTAAMSNRALALDQLGRHDEARQLRQQLAVIEPEPPFAAFNRGLAAIRAGDYRTARDQLEKEAARSGDYHEVHFWLAVAYAGLGDAGEAQRHLTMARENSTTRQDRELYAAKLQRIESGVH
jgi:Flp pilus assembly protein TadD